MKTDLEKLNKLEKEATPDNQGKYLLHLRIAASSLIAELKLARLVVDALNKDMISTAREHAKAYEAAIGNKE